MDYVKFLLNCCLCEIYILLLLKVSHNSQLLYVSERKVELSCENCYELLQIIYHIEALGWGLILLICYIDEPTCNFVIESKGTIFFLDLESKAL